MQPRRQQNTFVAGITCSHRVCAERRTNHFPLLSEDEVQQMTLCGPHKGLVVLSGTKEENCASHTMPSLFFFLERGVRVRTQMGTGFDLPVSR